MFKIFSSISLSILFLIVSLNIHLDLHYCHDELTEISFNHNDDEHCGGMKANTCTSCEDVHIELDNEQDQISFDFKTKVNHFNLPDWKPEITTIHKSLVKQKINVLNGSDSSPPPKLYKLYSKYCFYG